jgi:drug/metabolite transporter (DMT)-like permease
VAALLALLSSALWGSADFVGGVVSRRLPAVAVVGWSQTAGLVAITTVAATRGELAAGGGWLGWSVFAGVSGTAGLVAFYTALSTGTMGVVSPLAALGIVVPVVAGLAAGDRPHGLQVLGMVLGGVGAIAAGGPELSGRTLRSAEARSVLLALLAGIFFGAALMAIQRGADYSPLMTTVGMRLTTVVIFVVVALAVRSHGGIRPRDLPVIAAIGVMDVAANLVFALASTRGMDSMVAVVGALYPVMTVLLGAVVLGERVLPVQRVSNARRAAEAGFGSDRRPGR